MRRQCQSDELATLGHHDHYVAAVAFSPDGKWLLSGGYDGLVKLWEVHCRRLVFSPDGRRLAWVSTTNVLVLDPESRAPPATVPDDIQTFTTLAFAPAGRQLAGGQWPGLIPVWDLATRRQVACLSNHTAWVSSLTFSRDGMRLASASADQQIVRWDASTWRPSATLKGHRGEIWALAISPEGELLATGGKDKTVRLWSTSPQPAEQNELSAQRVWVSPSGRFCVLSFVDSSGAITNRELVDVATLARRSLGPSPRMRIAWSTNSDACGRRSFDGATVPGRMVPNHAPRTPSKERHLL